MVYPSVYAAEHRSARLRSGLVDQMRHCKFRCFDNQVIGCLSLGHTRESPLPCAASESTHQINCA